MNITKPFVDFIIVGSMKSGTTTLADILKSHHRVVFCALKEPQFFSESVDWKAELPKYRSLFPDNLEGKIAGEASTGYSMFPEFNKHVWDDIYAFNPKMKFIYLMRDPVARVVSHYIHFYTRGYTRLPFHEAIIKEPEYINRTRYYTQIKPFIDVFGKDQVMLITFEHFLKEKREVLRQVADFLGIDYDFKNFHDTHSNKAKEEVDITLNKRFLHKVKNPLVRKVINTVYKKVYNIKMTPPEVTKESREIIWRLLEQEVDNIEGVLGRKLTEWPSCMEFKYASADLVR